MSGLTTVEQVGNMEVKDILRHVIIVTRILDLYKESQTFRVTRIDRHRTYLGLPSSLGSSWLFERQELRRLYGQVGHFSDLSE